MNYLAGIETNVVSWELERTGGARLSVLDVLRGLAEWPDRKDYRVELHDPAGNLEAGLQVDVFLMLVGMLAARRHGGLSVPKEIEVPVMWIRKLRAAT